MTNATSLPSGFILTAGGRILCRQCTAKSKRTGVQCRGAAIKDSPTTKCRAHGGKSTGPKTPEGRARIAAANTVHGNETRAKRHAHGQTVARLAALEALARGLNMMSGPRTRGPKPKQVVNIFDLAPVFRTP